MTKNLVMALVAVMAVGQTAQAASTGKEKPGSQQGAKTAKDAEAAKKSATTGADAKTAFTPEQTAAKKVIESLQKENLLSKLVKDQVTNLEKLMTESAQLRAAVTEAIGQAKSSDRFVKELGMARIVLASNLKNIRTGADALAMKNLTPQGEAELACVTMVLDAGKIADKWDQVTLQNLTAVMNKTSEIMNSSRMELGDAAIEARTELMKPKDQKGADMRFSFKEIIELCTKKS